MTPVAEAISSYTCGMDKFDRVFEQFKVTGQELVDKVRDLIHEGNVRRIIVKDERGHTFMEIPLTVAAVGAVAAPILAALGAIATLVSKFDISVERSGPAPGSGSGPQTTSNVSDSNVGAREDQMNMAGPWRSIRTIKAPNWKISGGPASTTRWAGDPPECATPRLWPWAVVLPWRGRRLPAPG